MHSTDVAVGCKGAHRRARLKAQFAAFGAYGDVQRANLEATGASSVPIHFVRRSKFCGSARSRQSGEGRISADHLFAVSLRVGAAIHKDFVVVDSIQAVREILFFVDRRSRAF